MIRYPCDYVDKGGLAVTDNARGCSGTPTWQLVVAGALDPAHVRRALGDLGARYPSLRTKVHALDGPKAARPLGSRRFAYVEDAAFTVDAIFRVVDAPDEATLAAVIHEEQNRPLDLFGDFPVTLTLARTGADSCRLVFRQHHAIADGRAFIGLLADFAGFLEAARTGARPSAAALAPIHRRDELAPLGLSRGRRLVWRLAGYVNLVRLLVRALYRPVVPLLPNLSNDYRGDNGTVHWILADDALAAWNGARQRIGVSLNSLLTAALFCAMQRWHRARGAPLGRTSSTLVMETRPRDGGFVSFANHLATLDVTLALDRVDDAAAMARTIQAQVDAQRRSHRPIKRLLAERALVLGMTLAQLRRIVFESKRPSYNLNFSNLIALEFPTLGGAGWRVEEVLITTPVTPRTGLALTAIRYNGRLVLNFNYKASAVSRADTAALCQEFQAVMAELAPSS